MVKITHALNALKKWCGFLGWSFMVMPPPPPSRLCADREKAELNSNKTEQRSMEEKMPTLLQEFWWPQYFSHSKLFASTQGMVLILDGNSE